MSAFLPSFFQKRLLRYALSRLELVDTDALDLDSLGIAWGQKEHANVSLVRVTIPADIYNSAIIVEVEGIDLQLKLSPDKSGRNASSPSRSGGACGGDEQSGHSSLPSTTDLAQSFLESEPKEETEELQAALMSQSQHTQNSDSPSEDGEEELGLHDGVSLPSFVAGFLKGVVNRLQLKIANVSLRVDMEVGRDGTDKNERRDAVSGLFTVQDIAIEGVATSASDDPSVKIGKRKVSLAGIHAMIISDAEVFSNYSRFYASESTTHSKPSHTPLRTRSPEPSSSSSDSCGDMAQSTILDPSMHSSQFTDDTYGNESCQLDSSAYSTGGRFSDAASDDGDDQFYSEMSDSHYGERFLDNPVCLEEALQSQFDDHIEDSTILPGDPSTPVREAQTPRAQTPQSPGSSPEHYMYHSIREDNSPVQDTDLDEDSDTTATHPDEPVSRLQASGTTSAPGHTPTQVEDLSASRIFTHEEAQSMYMSAMSYASTNSSPDMPGAWGSSTSEEISGEKVGSANLASLADGEEATSDTFNQQTRESSDDPVRLQNITESPPEGNERSAGLSSSPGGFSGVAKELVSIDKAILWIPVIDSPDDSKAASSAADSKPTDHMADSTSSLADSMAPNMLPYSRLRSTQSTFRRGSVSSVASLRHPALPRQTAGSQRSEEFDGLTDSQRARAVEIDVTSLSAKFDIASGWLLLKMGQQFADVCASTKSDPKGSEPTGEESSPLFVSLNLASCSFKFLERVAAHPYPISTSPPYQFSSGIPIEGTILHLTLSKIIFDFAAAGNTTKVHLKIMKFVLGHMSQDIISFDERLKMRESTRDIRSPGHGDISLQMIKSAESIIIKPATLPMCVSLNLQKLDEMLGWFGGLSTVLELGSSIASASTVKGGQPCPPPRPRGVHFADAVPTPRPKTNNVAVKVTCRIGGIVLRVIGEHCTVQLATTAAKLLSRPEYIALQIDKATISGPHLRQGHSDSSASFDLDNLRFMYLYGPQESDLDRLLALLTPSKDKYDNDDDIMLDTLFRQRRQGAVIRLTVDHANLTLPSPATLQPLTHLSSELAKLATVAKYLPQDDRPGLLILGLIQNFEGQIHVNRDVGDISVISQTIEAAYVTFPSLIATRISAITVVRNGSEELVAEAIPEDIGAPRTADVLPMIMVRFIADDMDPTVKVKLYNLRVEYTVPFVTAILGGSEALIGEDVAVHMAQSVLSLADLDAHSPISEPGSINSEFNHRLATPPKISVGLKDCIVGLNPRKPPAKALVILTRATFNGALHKSKPSEASLDIRKASIMLIDDVGSAGPAENYRSRRPSGVRAGQIHCLEGMGYVPVCDISSASVLVKVMQLDAEGEKSLDVEVRDDLLVLETCADSTQTLISILGGLTPLSRPTSTERKYRTEIMPLEDMLNSLSGNAFATDAGSDASPPEDEIEVDGDGAEEVEYVSVFYPSHEDSEQQRGLSSMGASQVLSSFHSEAQMSSSIPKLDFQDDHFAKKSAVNGTAHRWDSTRNTYNLATDIKFRDSPLRVRVRDVHVIWNLYDGYDWQHTRDTISKAVKDVQMKAAEKLARRPGNRLSADFDEEEESVIGDFLFNSVYIGIPANGDPRELSHDINRNIDDLASETMSYATSTTVTAMQNTSGAKREKLRLARSKHHKMTFELKGISADLIVFPPGSGETQSSLDVRVEDLEIFDHVPTSTWKKFATYMHDVGEREIGTSMVHLEILNVKPVPDLAASEIVLKATVLPLRLHVDQDALDFLSRFFEFKDESATSQAPEDIPFLQRVEVNAIRVRLDFKPKRVDYAGLRSGRTTEFMNFFILDEADMVLRHVIVYGVSGFDRLGQTLNDIWMPDIKANQLPTVLAGIAPVRSLVNIGSGVKDLVLVPMREYKKDGRIVRSVQKGAIQFAKTTTSELLKLGAKLAIGTQTALESAEDFLSSPRGLPTQSPLSDGRRDDNHLDEGERPRISLYADQPLGVAQGLRGAYASLERDLLFTRDVIVAVPGEIMESRNATEAAKRVMGRASTVVFRPAIGASKAVSRAFLGANNTIEPENRRRIEDKYKKHTI
ncbi:predicted protein [Uncinocarpus reesii 1704]|uniref:Autophagy-related protein 2 n=1 Tax=Uncinocarpus reesii (strain UAMH 1704) TaxID=336963 RepID=C4JSE6_UNCRE|nr:uncharacterized protein UREG_05385 [Uncinocarpus reesii 1704]EEP80543.1 predicted protein [Uncinocarpus reesii 1704]